MYTVSIITVGSLKEQYWKDAEHEYIKRFTPYANIDVCSMKEYAFRAVSEKETVLIHEGELILKKIPKDAYCILLDRTGVEVSSESFAECLKHEGERGRRIVCIIGGPLGISEAVRKRAHKVFSFSHLTLPHQLARIVLIEQIYRAMTIIHGKQYHY